MALQPTVDDLLDFLALTEANYPVDQAQEALDSAIAMQTDRCVVEPYESPLREAAMRRAARILAARGAPLGATDLGEFGSSPLLRFDALIEELEIEYRIGGFA